MKKIFEGKYFFRDSDDDCVQIEVEKATSEEAVESINLKNSDYLISIKKISADYKDVLVQHDEDDEGKSCTDELERKFGSNKWSKSDTKKINSFTY